MGKVVTYFNTKNNIIDELISECQMGPDFKLSDSKFNLALEEFNANEDTTMVDMINVPKERGSFVRLNDGWLFHETN